MGLCTEFGPHIRHDCLEPMVAEVDRCSCPVCHAVCTGKFVGCQNVWDRGPQTVTLRARALGPPDAIARTSNGNGNGNGNGHVAYPVNGSVPATNRDAALDALAYPSAASPPFGSAADSPAFYALLEEIKILNHRIEETRVQRRGPSTEDDLETYFAATNALLATLPDRIAEAVGDALVSQHKMIMRDVEAAFREFARRVERTRPPR